eukprot:SAG31_NODE_2199_length_6208_cov_3.935996_6_plen_80_part_00
MHSCTKFSVTYVNLHVPTLRVPLSESSPGPEAAAESERQNVTDEVYWEPAATFSVLSTRALIKTDSGASVRLSIFLTSR